MHWKHARVVVAGLVGVAACSMCCVEQGSPPAASPPQPQKADPGPTKPPAAATPMEVFPAGWVRIEAGTFDMGSPEGEQGSEPGHETQHKVTLTHAYWMKATEVTQGEWQQVMAGNPSKFTSCGEHCPVENVTWYEAVVYCNALSKKEGAEVCYTELGGSPYDALSARRLLDWPKGVSCAGYRLPTEAEWEYAARAGTTARYTYADVDRVAWNSRNSEETTHPVKQKEANAWGLYDMLGNVWEWAWDWQKEEYGSGAQRDPLGPSSGSRRIVRGCSWHDSLRCQAASRFDDVPDWRFDSVGFRPVRSIP